MYTGSVVSLEANKNTKHFERVFISFKACLDGFKKCRPMLFIDRTFMIGRVKGTLLAATAKDGDNGIATWHVQRRHDSKEWTGALCPIKEMLWHQLTAISRMWPVIKLLSGKFKVLSRLSVEVDLSERTCSCHKWQVMGFPCAHAVAVMQKNCNSVYNLIEDASMLLAIVHAIVLTFKACPRPRGLNFIQMNQTSQKSYSQFSTSNLDAQKRRESHRTES
ncbi:hypothetical protein OROMI_008505 [Orobanche minor]